jgi:hypothetical protein
MDEEAHFLLSFSPYISFLEERGKRKEKDEENFDCFLSYSFLSFFLFEEKTSGNGREKGTMFIL